MEKIKIDISSKIVEIECSKCGKIFIERFDELLVKSMVKCPSCGQEYLIKLKE